MNDAGYKQKIIWVPKDSEKEAAKLERKIFLNRIEALTAGWTKAKMSKLFKEVLVIIKERINEE